MRAVVLGPGRVGCGFAGHVLRSSGYDLVFVARNQQLVDHFNRVGHYRVRLVGSGELDERVDGVRAVAMEDPRSVVEAIKGADLVVSAVTSSGVSDVAPILAAGLRECPRPVNVIALENLHDAGWRLRARVKLSDAEAAERHGFTGGLVGRAVSWRLGDPAGDEPLTFVGDRQDDLVVYRCRLRRPFPRIKGMLAVDDYEAHVRRKLFTFSAGHAATAYFGHLKGYRYIHTAIRDSEIRSGVLGVMREGQFVVAAHYGPEFGGDDRDLIAMLSRFENAGLDDPIARVGRDPRRKLGPDDRLVGPAVAAEPLGIHPSALTLAVGAALCFDHPDDPPSGDLHREIADRGLGVILRRVCGLDIRHPIGRSVSEAFLRLGAGRRNNLLLSMNRHLWAWDDCADPPADWARTG